MSNRGVSHDAAICVSLNINTQQAEAVAAREESYDRIKLSGTLFAMRINYQCVLIINNGTHSKN